MRQSSKSSSTPASESSSTPPEAAADILPVSDALVVGEASSPVDTSINKPFALEGGPKNNPDGGLCPRLTPQGKDPHEQEIIEELIYATVEELM